MRKIFPETSYTNCGGETIPRLFSKKLKLSQVEGYRNILKLNCISLAFTSYKAFLINKKMSGTSLVVLFAAWFLTKNIFLITFY